MDGFLHLMDAPEKLREIWAGASRAFEQLQTSGLYALAPDGNPFVDLTLRDKRFQDAAWQAWPFNLLSQSFLLTERWADSATSGIDGVSPHHEKVMGFRSRLWMDCFSPSNGFWTNPEVLAHSFAAGGTNLVRGLLNLAGDQQRALAGQPPAGVEAFGVGETVAVTPGKVVFRNRLIELIRYGDATSEVFPEPVLIVPAWIMKFYILDLSPANSLVGYLVGQGHTVFMVSWLNPEEADRDLSLDDYLRLGVMAALEAVGAAMPGRKIHAAGYCLGGTLLAMAAAAMARDGDERLASLSLLAAQTDFSEPGQLSLFIDEAQIACLEQLMSFRGYLDTTQMAAAFRMMNAPDLIWSRLVADYLQGERRPMTDLAAWNLDGTRLPARMHGEYLRQLYLHNDLAEGRYRVGGAPVDLHDIALPVFCLGTLADQVAPWRSVYKLHGLTAAGITFVLATGGHNAGIVNPPGAARGAGYQSLVREPGTLPLDVERWQETAVRHGGSWWPAWSAWLKQQSGAALPRVSRRHATAAAAEALCDAPGTYVLGA